MVYVKSTKKPAKHTYAERVLHALDQITTKKRRASSIHISTLRAQVRKNAEEEEDKLGPSWSKWVVKGLHRLQDDGIVDATDVSALTLTPSGKKVIADQRHALGMEMDSNDLAEQHLLVKRALSHASSRATKRPRISVGAGEVSESVSTRFARSASKRQSSTASTRRFATALPRKSGATVQGASSATPRSRMTRAQLQEELEWLQQNHDEALRTAIEQGNEEGERLRSMLARYQEELEAAHAELAGAHQQDEDTNEGLALPEMDINLDEPSTPISSPILGQINTPLPNAARGKHDVARTQSSTIIPDLSKQPTPAPSSPERDDDAPLPEFNSGGLGSRSFSGQMLTPGPTPNRLGTRVSYGAKDIAQLQASFNRVQQTLHEEADTEYPFTATQKLEECRAKLAELEDQVKQQQVSITERDLIINEKKNQLDEANSAKLATKNSLDDALSRIAVLEDSLDQREGIIACLKAELETSSDDHAHRIMNLDLALASVKADAARELNIAVTQRDSLQQQVQELQQDLSARIASHQQQVQQLHQELSNLTTARQHSQTEVENTMLRLQEKEELIDEQVQHLNQLAEKKALVEGQLENVRGERDTADSQAKALQIQVSQLEANLCASQNEVYELHQRLELRDCELQATTSSFESTFTKEKEKFQKAIVTRDAALQGANRTVQFQAQEVKGIQESHTQVRKQLETSSTRADRLHGQLNAEKERLANLEVEFDESRAKLAQSAKEIDELKASKLADNATITRMKDQFALIKAFQMQVMKQLDEVTSGELA